MFSGILLFSFCSIYRTIYKSSRLNNNPCWRSAFISTAVVWGLIVVCITEFLSLFSLLVFGWVFFLWGTVFIITMMISRSLPKAQLNITETRLPHLSNVEKFSLISMIVISALVGFIALASPPNNWDALAYHMSRVFHWIQNHNVNPYPTHIPRQLMYSPGAEFIVLQFQILSGSDYFANFVQWWSMIGCVMGVSLIAKQLGANRRAQIFSALICATIPMGILQGSSAQTDYVTAFWLVCFIHYLLLMMMRNSGQLVLFLSGASMGLLILVKGTAYLYAVPFLVWFIIVSFKENIWRAFKNLSVIIGVPFLINAGYYIRNIDVYKTSFIDLGVTVNGMTPALFIFNLMRHAAIHLSSPIASFNTAIYRLMESLHSLLKLGMNDKRITLEDFPFSLNFTFHEDTTTNFVHLFLILLSMIIIVFSPSRRIRCNLRPYQIYVISTFLLISLIIQWSPFSDRYHLPFFVIAAPFMAIALFRANVSFKGNKFLLLLNGLILLWVVQCYLKGLPHDQKWLILTVLIALFLLYYLRSAITLISVILVISAFPWVLFNQTKSLIGQQSLFKFKRSDRYFANVPSRIRTYMGAVDYLCSLGCSDVGLIIGRGDWEYPFDILLRDKKEHKFRLEHVNVTNPSKIKYSIYPFNTFRPCAIIHTKSLRIDRIVCKDNIYIKRWSDDDIGVFVRE